jgi:hypothetical protein
VRQTQTRTLAVLLLLTAGVGPASGQTGGQMPPDPADNARIQAGPLSVNPRLELVNVGVDSNIRDEAFDAKEDFTATLRPSLDATLRFGRGRLRYRGSLDAVYFHTYKDERSINRSGEIRLEARLTRFVPYVSVAGLATRERPNREIDLRARRTTQTVAGGASLLIFSRTSIVGEVKREIFRYDATEFFRGENLSRGLNERRTTINGGLRLALTPLTTLSLTAAAEQDRFDASPDRDADTLRIMPALEFDPSALLAGSVSVGFRRFKPLHGTMPPFRGVVAQVSTRYTLLGRTRFALQASRDLDYSYLVDEPYYLRTGAALTITQAVGGPFDVQVSGGRDRLEYRTAIGSAEEAGTDTTDVGGGGIGYRLADTARIGVNIEFTRRRSPVVLRAFDRRRIFGSLTYGF